MKEKIIEILKNNALEIRNEVFVRDSEFEEVADDIMNLMAPLLPVRSGLGDNAIPMEDVCTCKPGVPEDKECVVHGVSAAAKGEDINMNGAKNPSGCGLGFYCNFPKCACLFPPAEGKQGEAIYDLDIVMNFLRPLMGNANNVATCISILHELKGKLMQPPAHHTGSGELTDADEKEVMMTAFDKVYKIFQARSWIMEGRGSYRYDDDRYKEEVRYLFDEFEQLHKDTWANIKTKSFEYRKEIIDNYLRDNQPAGFTLEQMGEVWDCMEMVQWANKNMWYYDHDEKLWKQDGWKSRTSAELYILYKSKTPFTGIK